MTNEHDITREFTAAELEQARRERTLPDGDPRKIQALEEDLTTYKRLGYIALGAWFVTTAAALAVILAVG